MKKFLSVVFLSVLFPGVALAATDIPSIATGVLNPIYQYLAILAVSIAFIVFFWGLALYIRHAGDEKKRADGRNIMIWGVVILTVMVAVGGIIAMFQQTFGLQNRGIPEPSATPLGPVGP